MGKLYLVLGALVVLAMPGFSSVSISLHQATLTLLHQRLQKTQLGTSTAVVQTLSGETGSTPADVRLGLLALLDQLEKHRKDQTTSWQRLVEIDSEISPKQADRFLGRLLQESRKVLTKEGTFGLDSLLKRAARKSRLAGNGGLLLERMVAMGLGESTPGREAAQRHALLETLPQQIGLAITVIEDERNKGLRAGLRDRLEKVVGNPQVLSPYLKFFGGSDVDRIVDQVDQVEQQTLWALKQALPASPRVKWVVEQGGGPQTTDFELSLRIIQFFMKLVGSSGEAQWTGAEPTLCEPCILNELVLRHRPSNQVLLRRPLGQSYPSRNPANAVAFCAGRAVSGQANRLDAFYEALALETQQAIEDFMDDPMEAPYQ